jgi:hypothetical protein
MLLTKEYSFTSFGGTFLRRETSRTHGFPMPFNAEESPITKANYNQLPDGVKIIPGFEVLASRQHRSGIINDRLISMLYLIKLIYHIV